MQQNIHHHQILSVNKLSKKSKKTFKQRTISSIFIIVVFLLFFACSVLSDTQWGWSANLGLTVNKVFTVTQIALLLVVSFIAAIEITNLFFYKNKLSFCVIYGLILIFFLTSAVIFFFAKFSYFNLSQYELFLAVLVSGIVNIIFIFFVIVLYFWMQGLFTLKRIFTAYALILLVSIFCVGWLYFALFKGWTTIFFLYIITALTDVFAYLGGMLFGKQKLSPFISPNKTIAGAIIGVTSATIICCALFVGLSQVPSSYNILGNFFGIQFKYVVGSILDLFASSPLWWFAVVVILICLSCLSIVGDLVYSYIKRNYGIKDYSQLIPGHGGMLDRIDSLTFVIPAYFIFITGISAFATTISYF